MNKTLVVNFFAGPGARKTTIASDVFAELKWNGVNCELIQEYAKKKTWEKTQETLKDQSYVFAKQNHAQFICMDTDHELEVIITDSPIPLSLVYASPSIPASFEPYVMDTFNSYNNLNYYVVRKAPYNPKGRNQTEEEARDKDMEVMDMLTRLNIPYQRVNGERTMVPIIANDIMCSTRFPTI